MLCGDRLGVKGFIIWCMNEEFHWRGGLYSGYGALGWAVLNVYSCLGEMTSVDGVL
ncbi:hypothetical protein BDV28DRAFT_127661 [Aspergillus coremiiformis]|uniref:Uncharacterized protein n=1 Tax=Aspergillus coremiiformis TaxID=138285 RepID=A0A5N6ZGP2_9EURO|nr:hypothetical protein BDV28DRAFT_127661 [Aspergillus coremiiformis]